MTITDDIKYIGVDDHGIDLFEGMYRVPNGMSYNSYAIIDEKIAIMDTVDVGFTAQWLHNIQSTLGTRKPDYLIVQHMEPDHSANIMNFMKSYPTVKMVASSKAFEMMKNYFGTDFAENRIVVSDGDMLSLGKHKLLFATAPMVHWPEVIITYDSTEQVLFSADAFGKFGTINTQEAWTCEARRYYFGIIGKFGVQVQRMLQKIAVWDICKICPLHGPVLIKNISHYIRLYHIWSSYQPEEEGVVIAYTSTYGNTKNAVILLQEKLKEKGCPHVIVKDLARCDMTEAVADAFRYRKLVLATITYNADIFPFMREYINALTERNFSNRVVAFMENGSWAPIAAKVMQDKLEKCKGLIYADTTVTMRSILNEESMTQLELLVDELTRR